MKNNMAILLTTLLILATGCESNDSFAELNVDPKQPTEIGAEPIFTGATKALFDELGNSYDGFSTRFTGAFNMLSRYHTQTQFVQESNYNFNERQTESIFWQRMYQILNNLKLAKEIVQADEFFTDEEKRSRTAQITILEVYTWQVLVDTFGDIPFTEALDSELTLLPKYDDAQGIYMAISEDLDEAINSIDIGGNGFSTSDLIYQGDLSLWKKLGNSLKLKIGITLADVDVTTSKRLCEEAAASGVFTNRSENMKFQYLSSAPNTNPLWVILIQNPRNDYVISSEFADAMNDLNDPRRIVFFKDNILPYTGGVFGAINLFESFTAIGSRFEEPDLEGLLLSFYEVEFYLAEASERGFNVGGTAAMHYNSAVKASFDYWGIASADSDTYLLNPDVVYNSATWRNQIGSQLWIAMYNRGFEGWKAYRKYDFDTFEVAFDSGLNVPTRLKYAQTEQNINKNNLDTAAEAIGGDTTDTKLFWDLN